MSRPVLVDIDYRIIVL